ncbi:MAG: D-alanine--D-alanine ligase [Myxococcota bacterium]
MSRESGTWRQGRVGVLMGGASGEHEVSLQSGEAMASALADRGYDVTRVVLPAGVERGPDSVQALLRAELDVALVALHGRQGEDGCVQGLLEMLRIPYTGAGVLGSAVAMDKAKSKELFLLHNVPTPPYYLVSVDDDRDEVEDLHRHFGFPVIVKPRGEGSSLALSKCYSLGELKTALDRVFEIDDWAMVERFVSGAEVNVGIVDGDVLGAIEVCPRHGLYDYEAKYSPGGSEYHMPARLTPARYQNVLHLARRAAEAVGAAAGGVRVDLLVTEGENEYVLEVNTLPGMTETSLLPKIAAAQGMDFGDLCEAILDGARLHVPQRAPVRQSTTRIRRRRRETSLEALVAETG